MGIFGNTFKHESKESSKTPEGGERVTMHASNGSSRDVTKEQDGSITVTDHRPDGTSVTGDGVRTFPTFQSLEDTPRVNTRR